MHQRRFPVVPALALIAIALLIGVGSVLKFFLVVGLFGIVAKSFFFRRAWMADGAKGKQDHWQRWHGPHHEFKHDEDNPEIV